ncbi:MAG: sulfatase [Nocardioidaceae bacterium]
MAKLALALRGRSRLLVPLVALVALVLVVAGVLTSLLNGSGQQVGPPAGKNTAEPAEIVPSGSPAPQQATRPNVVMVLADDMRTDDLRWMPHVRSLIEDQGLNFRNSFSPNPLCAPARASLLTGQYSQNTGVYSVTDANGFKAFDDRRTLATSLNSAGYNTMFLGKYLNGYGDQDSLVTGDSSFRYVPAGWTDWAGSVNRPADSGYPSGGTYSYYHVIFNRNGTIDDTHKGHYQVSVEGRVASRMIRKYHRSPKPFFLYFAPVAPHFGLPREQDDPTGVTWPGTGKRELIKTPARPKSVRGIFDKEIPRASGLPANGGPSERNMSDKPLPERDFPELNSQERGAVRTLTRQRAETLYVLDQQVKRLVRTLKETGEYANTVIMFSSDNGYFLGEHRVRQGKIKPHEPSLRVPFVMAGPGIPHGQRFDPITTQDVAATILDLAGAKPPHPADGLSVLPSVRADRGWRVPVLTEGFETSTVFKDAASHPAPGFDDPRTTIGIRTPGWKYVRYSNGDGELYDLDQDPNELTSHFGQPAYAGIQRELQRVWLAYKDCAGASCRVPLPTDLQRSPAQDRVQTDRQSAGVQRRYGYYR